MSDRLQSPILGNVMQLSIQARKFGRSLERSATRRTLTAPTGERRKFDGCNTSLETALTTVAAARIERGMRNRTR